jgi:hypothetical protein
MRHIMPLLHCRSKEELDRKVAGDMLRQLRALKYRPQQQQGTEASTGRQLPGYRQAEAGTNHRLSSLQTKANAEHGGQVKVQASLPHTSATATAGARSPAAVSAQRNTPGVLNIFKGGGYPVADLEQSIHQAGLQHVLRVQLKLAGAHCILAKQKWSTGQRVDLRQVGE